jgi:hypothetical protein
MDRRDLLGVLGTTAAGLFAVNARARGADDQAQHHSGAHSECQQACQNCARSCSETFHHCYEQVAAGKKEHAKALRLVADCAKFCMLSADMIASGSPLMVHSCGACAEACKACGAECGRFDSTEMKECAQACETCEKSCRAMVQAMGGAKSAGSGS